MVQMTKAKGREFLNINYLPYLNKFIKLYAPKEDKNPWSLP